LKEGENMLHQQEINRLISGLVNKYNNLKKILLFGSQASNLATEKSDIDICIVADVEDKDSFEQDVNLYIYDSEGLDFSKSVDIILYTTNEWEKCLKEQGTFANLIQKKGVVLHG
jgi:predicted nucleotidyltransferase